MLAFAFKADLSKSFKSETDQRFRLFTAIHKIDCGRYAPLKILTLA